jgi:GAF domain-containing protein
VHVQEEVLQRAVGTLAQHDLRALDLRAACETVVGTLPGLFEADGAGILLVDEAHVLRYVASTDAGAQMLEAAQEALGHGPCVSSLVENAPVEVSDLLEDERWPDLGRLLASNGVRSVLGVPVHVSGVAVGSLNVYSSSPKTWDQSEMRAIATIETVVDRVLTAGVLSERQGELIAQLQRALETRVTVERAVGVLMGVAGLGAPEAFERIRRAARSSRRSVHDVSKEVIENRKLPRGVTDPPARMGNG